MIFFAKNLVRLQKKSKDETKKAPQGRPKAPPESAQEGDPPLALIFGDS